MGIHDSLVKQSIYIPDIVISEAYYSTMAIMFGKYQFVVLVWLAE